MRSFLILFVFVYGILCSTVQEGCNAVCTDIATPSGAEAMSEYKRTVHGICYSQSKQSVMLFQSCRQGIEWVAHKACVLGCDKKYSFKKIINLPAIGEIRDKCKEKKHQGPGTNMVVACTDGVKGAVEYFSQRGGNARTVVDSIIAQDGNFSPEPEEAIPETTDEVDIKSPTYSPTLKPTTAPSKEKHTTLENLESIGKNLKHKLESMLHKKEKSPKEEENGLEDDLYNELE